MSIILYFTEPFLISSVERGKENVSAVRVLSDQEALSTNRVTDLLVFVPAFVVNLDLSEWDAFHHAKAACTPMFGYQL